MARIAIKSNADRQIILCRDDRGFFIQTIHSDEKKPIEERVVTIGEAKQFYDRADEKAEKFNATGVEYREFVRIDGGKQRLREYETPESIAKRQQYEMRDKNPYDHSDPLECQPGHILSMPGYSCRS